MQVIISVGRESKAVPSRELGTETGKGRDPGQVKAEQVTAAPGLLPSGTPERRRRTCLGVAPEGKDAEELVPNISQSVSRRLRADPRGQYSQQPEGPSRRDADICSRELWVNREK